MLPCPGLAGGSGRSPPLWSQLSLRSFSALWEEAWQALSLFWGLGNDSELGLLAVEGEDSSAWKEEGWRSLSLRGLGSGDTQPACVFCCSSINVSRLEPELRSQIREQNPSLEVVYYNKGL